MRMNLGELRLNYLNINRYYSGSRVRFIAVKKVRREQKVTRILAIAVRFS